MEFVNDDGWIGWGWFGISYYIKRLGLFVIVFGVKRDVGVGVLLGSCFFFLVS